MVDMIRIEERLCNLLNNITLGKLYDESDDLKVFSSNVIDKVKKGVNGSMDASKIIELSDLLTTFLNGIYYQEVSESKIPIEWYYENFIRLRKLIIFAIVIKNSILSYNRRICYNFVSLWIILDEKKMCFELLDTSHQTKLLTAKDLVSLFNDQS